MNRRNAHKSTRPTTEEGKQRSRCNALRHGLTAETVIGALEDAEDYKTFEAAIIADYDAQSAVKRELVLRLASLLWQLRRASAIETAYSTFRLNICVGSSGPTKFAKARERLSMPCLDGLTQSASNPIQQRTAPTKRKRCAAPSGNRSILPRSSRVAFCFSPICLITRSTASADMKQTFGAKPPRSCLLLIPWTAVNHGIEGAVPA